MRSMWMFVGVLPLALSCRSNDVTVPGSLVSVTDEAAGANCEFGGLAIQSGTDTSGDGVLDSTEVTATYYVCDGAPAAPVSLLDVADEPEGANCQFGGVSISAGTDTNGDGKLGADEVDSTTYVCTPPPVLGATVQVVDEPAGANCAFGGLAVNTGVDTNNDGSLTDAEILDTDYLCAGDGVSIDVEALDPGADCANGGYRVLTGHDADGDGKISQSEAFDTALLCNGDNGLDGQNGQNGQNALPSLVALSAEPAGSNCANRGTAVKSGTDDNADGTLQAGEVDATSYVCDGDNGATALVATTPEAAGPHCAYGGTAVASGMDANANGTLDSGEVATTSYVCDPVGSQLPVLAFSNDGLTNITHDATSQAAYAQVPDMGLTFDLAGDYVVLTEFDINPVGASGTYAAFRLNVDGNIDTNWNRIRPEGGPDSDGSVHLFRIDRLSAGSHTIKAEWGEGSGVIANNPASAPYWMRRISAVAIPVDRGVASGMVYGTTDESRVGTGATPSFATIPGLTSTFTLAEKSVVISEYDLNVVGASGTWVADRFNIDGTGDVNFLHTQPQGGADEDDIHNLFEVSTLDAGPHTIAVEWGHGGGTVFSNAAVSKSQGRRMGYIAIPVSTGVQAKYLAPVDDQCKGAGAYTTVPGLDWTFYQTNPGWNVQLSQFDINWYGSATNDWMAERLAVDGVADAQWIHAQPQGVASGEDDNVSTHRVDYVGPGSHNVHAEWGAGQGTVCSPDNNATYKVWTRRLGVVSIPVQGY